MRRVIAPCWSSDPPLLLANRRAQRAASLGAPFPWCAKDFGGTTSTQMEAEALAAVRVANLRAHLPEMQITGGAVLEQPLSDP